MGGVADIQEVILAPVDWCAKAEQHLAQIAEMDPLISLDWMRRQVAEGHWFLIGAFQKGQRLATVAMAYEEGDKGKELVVLQAAGEKHINLVSLAFSNGYLEKLAQKRGATSIRFHTGRPGLVAMAKNFGYELAEMVVRKAVHHGR